MSNGNQRVTKEAEQQESWLYKDLWDVRNQITAANLAPAGKQY